MTRILVVEDEQDIATLLQHTLERAVLEQIRDRPPAATLLAAPVFASQQAGP